MASSTAQTAAIGFEDKLWAAAILLRNNMDSAEYKHIVLGLIFLKYISDTFEARVEEIVASVSERGSPDYIANIHQREAALKEMLEDRDEYTAENVFWVPPTARWNYLKDNAQQPELGKLVDDAMDAIEAANPPLKGSLPKVYALPSLNKDRLAELINTFSTLGLSGKGHQEKDTLGRVYEYFLSKFASEEGKRGGDFYTPDNIVRTIVEMLEPYNGRVYDPCCGSGGMFAQSLKFIMAHNGKRNAVTVFGQESNPTTWRLARMNMAIRGIEAKLGKHHADSFHKDLHSDLRADFVMANPPFNVSNWGGEQLAKDVRWKYGQPPPGNANYGWLQHILHHLAPGGTAGVVLANGSMSSQQSGEGEIRRRMVEADLVECMVAMPGQLFYSTQIPVCLWFLARNKGNGKFRDRKGQVLFIDARKLGRLDTRVHRVLDDSDIQKITGAYHAWRNVGGGYADMPGFCRSATLAEIKAHDFVLTPGRYVGAEDVEEEGEPFAEKMVRLTAVLREQQAEARRLDEVIGQALRGLEYV